MMVSGTLDQFVSQWLDTCDCTPCSRETYRRAMRYWYDWMRRSRRNIDAPQDRDVRDYKQSLLSSERSKYTVNRYVNTVVRFYRWCSAQQPQIWRAIGQGVRNEKVSIFCKRALTDDELVKLLDSVDTSTVSGMRDYTVILLMASNGLRPKEMCALLVCDIVEEGGVHYLRLLRKGHQAKDCKVKLAAPMYEQLRGYLSMRGVADETEPVFVAHKTEYEGRGHAISESMLTRMIKARMRSVYLTDEMLCAYSLRHTFATRMLRAGKTIDEVSWHMGHTGTAVTLRYLSMEREERMKQSTTVDEMAESLFSALKKLRDKKTFITSSDSSEGDFSRK